MDRKHVIGMAAPVIPILPHEICMCIMMLQIAARLVINAGVWEWVIYYSLLIIPYILLIIWGRPERNPLLYRIRLLWNIISMNFAFNSIRSIIPLLDTPVRDNLLANADMFLVGRDLSLLAQQISSRPLTEIMSLGYMLFILFLSLSFVYYGIGDIRRLTVFCTGLFSLYGIGITGYTIVPARGPYAFFADLYTEPLNGWFFTRLNNLMVTFGSSGFDVFPSLHVGAGLFLLLFFRRWNKCLYFAYLIPFVLLTFSTIYLRYHYLIDILCGAPLGVLCYLGSSLYHGISKAEIIKRTGVLSKLT